ncbi:MAG TPA: hypothetical protein VKB17_05220, partial [Thermoleophilaceae bacterium]|nr:hypothetical protein [Thermoleophilaceae bacterium]
MSRRAKILVGVGLYILLLVVVGAITGNAGKNEEFEPVEEFRLTPWIELKIGGLDLSINKAVFYLFLACGLT